MLVEATVRPMKPSRTLPRLPRLLAVGVVGALLLSGCGGASHAARPAGAPLQVVTAAGAWAGLARALGGDRVQVTNLVPANGDPHDYIATPDDALAVARADVVLIAGAGYDPFLDDLAGASPRQDRRQVRVSDVLGVTDPAADPHLWFDVAGLPRVVDALAQALGAADPAGAATYRAGAAELLTQVGDLQASVAVLKARTDAVRAGGAAGGATSVSVAVTEPVVSRLLAAVGLADATPPGFALAVENGGAPSARDVAAVRALVRERTVAALVLNVSTPTPASDALAALAAESGLPVVKVREAPPEGTPTVAWLAGTVAALSAATAGASR